MCNDGSPGAFYYHKASDPAMANVWLFYLEGGDWCYSAETCAMRYKLGPQFMTTNGAFLRLLAAGPLFRTLTNRRG